MSNIQYEVIPFDPGLFDGGYTAHSSPHLVPFSQDAHSLHPSSATSLDPLAPNIQTVPGALLTAEQAQLLHIRVQTLEEKVQKQEKTLEKRGYDADDEGGAPNRPKKRPMNKNKNKNNPNESRLITHKERKLTEEEGRVRKELLTHLEKNLKDLAGLQDGEEVLPDNVEPGERDGTIIPDFKRDVRYTTNKRLISQAAYIVYRDQTNTNTRHLSHENVRFTIKDVEELAKDAFRTWKRHHEVEVDPEVKQKKLDSNKKGMRYQRRREKKKDRTKVAGRYALLHNDVDVTPILLTDWMSEYLSDRSELVGDDKREEYRNTKLAKAGYLLPARDTGIQVWERIRPGFRSAEVNEIYAELDSLYEEDRKKNKKAKRTVPRVDLGVCNNDIPRSTPYPFMVDRAWKIVHVELKKREAKFEVCLEDPDGFGTNRMQPAGGSV